MKEVVLPSMLETHERLLDEVSEIREQVDKQAERLAILRERRLTDAGTSPFLSERNRRERERERERSSLSFFRALRTWTH